MELEKILNAHPKIVMMKIAGVEYSVLDILELNEMTQRNGGQWIQTGKQSLAVVLGKNTWLVKIPSKEAGKYIWLKCTVKEDSSSLGNFYKGGSNGDGPAKAFSKSNQTQPVKYQLFDKTWLVVDIGAFYVGEEYSGETKYEVNNNILNNFDQVYFVTSRSEDSKEWLLYLDARPGEAKGTGGVLIGVPFDPENEIEQTL